MTQRSIQAGPAPTVVVKAGGNVQVQGWDDERVLASTEHKSGLKIELHNESAVGRVRARAKVGDHVLFDLSTDLLKRKKDVPDDAIQVQVGGDVVVRVPYSSTLKVYAGRGAEVRDVRGSVAVYAARDARLRNVHALAHVSAGRAMDVECETLAGEEDAKFSAGRDLRFYIRDLVDARVVVNDLGGDWEGIIGAGARKIRLTAGGDVTLVTKQEVKPLPPDYVLGNIESPREDAREDKGGSKRQENHES